MLLLLLGSLQVHSLRCKSVCFCAAYNGHGHCSSSSLRYFSALSKGEPLPVKERIEMPLTTDKTDAVLTPGLLKILHKQVQNGRYQMHSAIEE